MNVQDHCTTRCDSPALMIFSALEHAAFFTRTIDIAIMSGELSGERLDHHKYGTNPRF